ncbi:MAG: 3'(2'),5'-bisphosphate nucleotidase [Marinilabiliales bacterium]|nr:MAG: 3'(2'),5'-bisphosphate nucleotidase [Marinilabiliales bacterium]
MNRILLTAIKAALNAGKEIIEVYNEDDFDVKIKSDNSPLTAADKQAHKIISEELSKTNIQILSEEGKNIPFNERSKWEIYWLVDPLDGTKEFIKRNGEFTVNIALIKKDTPILGVIYVPVTKDLYFSEESMGAFKAINIDHETDISDITSLMKLSFKLPFIQDNELFTIVGSRSHMNEETESFIKKLTSKHGEIDFISKGSSLKICMVAEGIANIYPRFAPTMEWDTAAGHAIALGSGCTVTQSDELTPVVYNKENLLNPWFIVKR